MKRARAALELRRAREAAGLTPEDLGRREMIRFKAQQPDRCPDDADASCAACRQWTARCAVWVNRMERTSQDAYDRAAADFADSDGSVFLRADANRRAWPNMFEEAVALVRLGDQTVSLADLYAQLRAEHEARRATAGEAARDRPWIRVEFGIVWVRPAAVTRLMDAVHADLSEMASIADDVNAAVLDRSGLQVCMMPNGWAACPPGVNAGLAAIVIEQTVSLVEEQRNVTASGGT